MLKICGIADIAFARVAAESGVDFLGFVFAPDSPRRVRPEKAARIGAAARAAAPVRPDRPLRTVGVFTPRPFGDILRDAEAAGLDVVQFHGRFPPEAAAAAKARGYETWLLDDGGDPRASPADGVLVDGAAGGRSGGTGTLADWTRVAAIRAAGKKAILAGGLSAANIAAAAATGADVLDVNSSLETAPGVKSAERLFALLRACPSGVLPA